MPGIPARPANGRPTGADLVRILEGQVGKPYKPNGESTRGFDCSGFLTWGLKNVGGPKIPSYTVDQFNRGRPVDLKNLRKGDAIFFNVPGDAAKPGHVAIFAGRQNGIPMVVNAANSRLGVLKQPLSYWTNAYSVAGARRYLPSR